MDWFIPKKEFHHYLQRIVEAGFGKRVMYGSDQMMWPDAIPLSVKWIEDAEFSRRHIRETSFIIKLNDSSDSNRIFYPHFTLVIPEGFLY